MSHQESGKTPFNILAVYCCSLALHEQVTREQEQGLFERITAVEQGLGVDDLDAFTEAELRLYLSARQFLIQRPFYVEGPEDQAVFSRALLKNAQAALGSVNQLLPAERQPSYWWDRFND